MDITTIIGTTGTPCWALLFYVVDPDAGEIAYIGKGEYATNKTETVAGGTDQAIQAILDATLIHDFKIIRASDVITVYEWDTDDWKWNGSTDGLQVVDSESRDLTILLKAIARSGDTINVDVDDFIINSGTVVPP